MVFPDVTKKNAVIATYDFRQPSLKKIHYIKRNGGFSTLKIFLEQNDFFKQSLVF
jgi:hypothetical protein